MLIEIYLFLSKLNYKRIISSFYSITNLKKWPQQKNIEVLTLFLLFPFYLFQLPC